MGRWLVQDMHRRSNSAELDGGGIWLASQGAGITAVGVDAIVFSTIVGNESSGLRSRYALAETCSCGGIITDSVMLNTEPPSVIDLYVLRQLTPMATGSPQIHRDASTPLTSLDSQLLGAWPTTAARPTLSRQIRCWERVHKLLRPGWRTLSTDQRSSRAQVGGMLPWVGGTEQPPHA